MVELQEFFKGCFYPSLILNKNHDKIVTRCNRCPACLNAKSAYLTQLCQCESDDSCYTMFATLTYNDLHLPRFSFEKGYAVIGDGEMLSCTPVSPDEYSAIMEKNPSLSYVRKTDIQKFLKRLRYYLKNETLRYFAVAEFGPEHLRVHWHLLLFFNSQKVSKILGKIIRKAWTFGFVNCSLTKGKSVNYVASYVNSTCDLPSFYQNNSLLRPWCSHSKFLGASYFKACREDVYNALYTHSDDIFFKILSTNKKFCPWRSLVSYFFPRCRGFSNLTFGEALQAYTIYRRFSALFGLTDVSALANEVVTYLLNRRSSWFVFDWFEQYIDYRSCVGNFDLLLSRVYSVLLTSKHFLTFVCTSDDYVYHVSKIYDYYSKLALSRLSDFYSAQESLFADQLLSDSSKPFIYLSFYSNYDLLISPLGLSYDDVASYYHCTNLSTLTYLDMSKRNPYFKTNMDIQVLIADSKVKHKKLNDRLGLLSN